MVKKIAAALALAASSLITPLPLLQGQQGTGTAYEIGIVYYEDGAGFKPLQKEAVQQSGRSNYSGRVKGAHATFRQRMDQPQVFLVCGVDPSRFKLYTFKSEKNARTVTIAKSNMWIGGTKVVLSEAEIPVTIQTAETGCFKLTPQKVLGNGEFGFSPVESMDAFMFGVGDVTQSK